MEAQNWDSVVTNSSEVKQVFETQDCWNTLLKHGEKVLLSNQSDHMEGINVSQILDLPHYMTSYGPNVTHSYDVHQRR